MSLGVSGVETKAAFGSAPGNCHDEPVGDTVSSRPGILAHTMRELAKLTNFERTRPDGPRDLDLQRPRRLLEALGSPHEQLAGAATEVVQIAGSKGKGSTTLFLDAMHRAAGRKTGRFTSPHLVSPLERITIADRPIEAANFARHVDRVLHTVRAENLETTFFESLLAVACLHFLENEIDTALFEVGIGGRLDATSILPTTASVLTQVSLEHTEILGDTVEAIAADKASIARAGVPFFSGVDPATPAGRVARDRAEAANARYHHIAPPECRAEGKDGVRMGAVLLPVLGAHQAHNAVIAAAAAETSGLRGEAIRRGLETVRLPARCEFLAGSPDVVLDGAHNTASIEATLRALSEHLPGREPTLLFALAHDKDLDAIAMALAPRVAGVVCTLADKKRGRDPEALARHEAWRHKAECVASPTVALVRALERAGAKGLILATGSLYLAGALRPALA